MRSLQGAQGIPLIEVCLKLHKARVEQWILGIRLLGISLSMVSVRKVVSTFLPSPSQFDRLGMERIT